MAKAKTASDARPASGRKLAEVVARQIEEDIVNRGWPVGQVIGSEAELLERYGVSRAVLREAVRIVEHHLVARMRRGPGGGLVVMAPDLSAVVRAVTLHLEFQNIQARDLHEARAALELRSLRLTAQRLTNDGIVRLQRAVLDSGGAEDFHVLIAELTGNPAMVLFQRVLGTLAREHFPEPPGSQGQVRELNRAHKRIAEALIARDAELAERLLYRHLEAVSRWLSLEAEVPVKSRAAKKPVARAK